MKGGQMKAGGLRRNCKLEKAEWGMVTSCQWKFRVRSCGLCM